SQRPRIGRARVRRQSNEQISHPLARVLADCPYAAAGWGLRGGLHERAAAESRVCDLFAEDVEYAEQAFPRRAVSRQALGQTRLANLLASEQVRTNQFFLAAEAIVQGCLRHAGALD